MNLTAGVKASAEADQLILRMPMVDVVQVDETIPSDGTESRYSMTLANDACVAINRGTYELLLAERFGR